MDSGQLRFRRASIGGVEDFHTSPETKLTGLWHWPNHD